MEVTSSQIVHAPLDVYIYLLRISATSPELGCLVNPFLPVSFYFRY